MASSYGRGPSSLSSGEVLRRKEIDEAEIKILSSLSKGAPNSGEEGKHWQLRDYFCGKGCRGADVRHSVPLLLCMFGILLVCSDMK